MTFNLEVDAIWGYCDLCKKDMVYCPKCYNNCCNASYGRIHDPKTNLFVDCDVCPSVYDYVEKHKWIKPNNKYSHTLSEAKAVYGIGYKQ